jgi:hypothetical protein
VAFARKSAVLADFSAVLAEISAVLAEKRTSGQGYRESCLKWFITSLTPKTFPFFCFKKGYENKRNRNQRVLQQTQ